mmetsp:Transcript_4451/g.8187  ORF Transcript_4451/g.8187 Transcript_4451/m.8187 type:complete len:378 (+) Transcript_4451:1870-3003(+)
MLHRRIARAQRGEGREGWKGDQKMHAVLLCRRFHLQGWRSRWKSGYAPHSKDSLLIRCTQEVWDTKLQSWATLRVSHPMAPQQTCALTHAFASLLHLWEGRFMYKGAPIRALTGSDRCIARLCHFNDVGLRNIGYIACNLDWMRNGRALGSMRVGGKSLGMQFAEMLNFGLQKPSHFVHYRLLLLRSCQIFKHFFKPIIKLSQLLLFGFHSCIFLFVLSAFRGGLMLQLGLNFLHLLNVLIQRPEIDCCVELIILPSERNEQLQHGWTDLQHLRCEVVQDSSFLCLRALHQRGVHHGLHQLPQLHFLFIRHVLMLLHVDAGHSVEGCTVSERRLPSHAVDIHRFVLIQLRVTVQADERMIQAFLDGDSFGGVEHQEL